MISVKDLQKNYKHFCLNISALEFKDGAVYALVGANGAGKTTLLSCLTNQISYMGGIYYDGKLLKENREEILSYTGFVGERLNFYGDALVRQYFSFMKSFYPDWDNDTFADLKSKLAVDVYEKVKLKNLSRGNALKVGLIACLSCRHKYIILDEPTSGLDVAMRQEFYGIINTHISHEATVIFSTHMVEDIDSMASHLVLLNNGVIVLNDKIDSLVQNNGNENLRNIIIQNITV
ncbi:MAG: ABC transporter ATP-binding protein [Clostridiales Family XIII bacterium]|jgi:ABC-2 type transport system ATP-binding protein|nr:ABC transporter ATP-binding protein [Clostridiales Family XIII bacterium]